MGCSASSEGGGGKNGGLKPGYRDEDCDDDDEEEEEEEEEEMSGDVVTELKSGRSSPDKAGLVGASLGTVDSNGNSRATPGGRKRKPVGETRRLAVMVEKDFNYTDDSGDHDQEKESAAAEPLEFHAKNDDEMQFLRKALSGIFIFEGIATSSDALDEFIHSFRSVRFERGTNIMEEGENGHELYILYSGEARVTTMKRDKNDWKKISFPRQFSISTPMSVEDAELPRERSSITLRKLEAGDLFGELALLYNTPRAATVTAFEDCEAFVTDRRAFRKAMLHSSHKSLIYFLRDVPLFRFMTNNSLNKIAALFTLENVEENEEIVPYGAPSGNFHIVKNGMVIKIKPQDVRHDMIDEVGVHGVIPAVRRVDAQGDSDDKTWDEKEIILETLGRCQFFGDRPIMSGECFDGQYVAGPDGAQMLVMTKDTFEAQLMPFLEESLEDNLKYDVLKSIKMMDSIKESDISTVVDQFDSVTLQKGQRVFSQGEVGDAMFIVKKGRVSVARDDKHLATLLCGSYFGEMALLSDDLRNASVSVISEEATLLKLNRDDFDMMLGPLKQIITMNMNMKVLQKVQLFESLNMLELEEIAEALKPETFRQGEVIIKEGEIGKKFYILKAGQASVSSKAKGGDIFRFKEGTFFGERALLQDEPRNATITAASESVTCLTISRQAFETHLSSLKDLIDVYAQKLRQKKEEKDIKLKELEHLCILGCGTYGRVNLVRHSKTGKCYAMKMISKVKIIQSGNQPQLKDEILTMQKLDHPFIISCPKAFGDRRFVYILMESIMGGELHTYIYEQHEYRLPEQHAKFYAAQLVKMLQHMSEHRIVHRDIKLENLMLDSRGYIRLVDFGFAKELKVGEKTYTFCGTPTYLAPELILHEGHALEVDLWAIGIVSYEMLFGHAPFQGSNESALFSAIVKDQPKFGKQGVSRDAEDFIRKLLSKDPSKRLGGTKSGFNVVLNHAWFRNYDWHNLERMTYKDVPYVPLVEDATDVSNFCEVRDEEVAEVMICEDVEEDRIFDAVLDQEEGSE